MTDIFNIETRKGFKIHSETFPGNLFAATTEINRRGWALYLITMDFTQMHTIAVFKMPTELVHEIREKNPSFKKSPDHDTWEPSLDV